MHADGCKLGGMTLWQGLAAELFAVQPASCQVGALAMWSLGRCWGTAVQRRHHCWRMSAHDTHVCAAKAQLIHLHNTWGGSRNFASASSSLCLPVLLQSIRCLRMKQTPLWPQMLRTSCAASCASVVSSATEQCLITSLLSAREQGSLACQMQLV